MQNKPRIRKFIRHPSDVPLQVSLNWVSDNPEKHPSEKVNNVSLGGLAFFSPKALPLDQSVAVSFPFLAGQHKLSGHVVWNRKNERGYEIGLQFDDPEENYRLRMIEQVCHIEHYRLEIEQSEGRSLSSEEAAREWIELYADQFPAIES